MRLAIRTSVRLFSESFEVSGPVVEIGSFYMPSHEQLCNLRPFFAEFEYIGCDIRQGLGVDRIEDAQALRFADGTVGTLILLEILEHLPDPNKAISEAYRVIKDDGLVILSVPFNARLHGFPSDYWRFTASGVYTLLFDFQDKLVFALGPQLKPAFIFAVATKRASHRFTEGKELFEKRVQETFKKSWVRGHMSVFKERARDFFGLLLGRAKLSVMFFDGSQGGGYDAKEQDE
jgi:2-polyprenyl-3-methyl-5-hydroxy-6-metoxy-1,4-benzoquinol methylase